MMLCRIYVQLNVYMATYMYSQFLYTYILELTCIHACIHIYIYIHMYVSIYEYMCIDSFICLRTMCLDTYLILLKLPAILAHLLLQYLYHANQAAVSQVLFTSYTWSYQNAWKNLVIPYYAPHKGMLRTLSAQWPVLLYKFRKPWHPQNYRIVQEITIQHRVCCVSKHNLRP